MREIGGKFAAWRACDYLVSPELIARYRKAARSVGERRDLPGLILAAEAVIANSELPKLNKSRAPRGRRWR